MSRWIRTRRNFLFFSGAAAASRLLPEGLPSDLLGSANMPDAASAGPRLRGLMVDAGRVPETLGYYRRVIDFCAEWELNALQFRLADDQGCAMRFSSVPDLLFHRNAFAPEQLHELAQYGRSHGVELIPELESFGHTGYITRTQAYAHLLDADTQLSTEFTGVIPVIPETLELFRKLYREIAAVFPSTFLHGGCDEVNWGGSSFSRKALETKQNYQIWAEYLNSLNHIAEGLGKQFIVWGDFVLHKEPRILAGLSKSIVVMDWNYTETDSAKVEEALAAIRTNGSRAIGAPALINYQWGARAGSEQLANIDSFAEAYFRSKDASSLGVILTNWVPSRYIQNSIWDGFAYGAVGFQEGPGVPRKSAFRRFVEKHYRADWNENWEKAFQLIYENAPQVEEPERAPEAVPLHVPWSNDEQPARVLRDRAPRSYPYKQLRNLLIQLKGKVARNLPDFQAFELSVAYLEQLYWREATVVEGAAKKPQTRGDAALLIKKIAESDRTLAQETLKGLGPRTIFQFRGEVATSVWSRTQRPARFSVSTSGGIFGFSGVTPGPFPANPDGVSACVIGDESVRHAPSPAHPDQNSASNSL